MSCDSVALSTERQLKASHGQLNLYKLFQSLYAEAALVQLNVRLLSEVGFVELCAKILQIMRNDFKDYACTFCQLFLPLFAKNLFRFCITHSRIQDQPILCLWDRQNSLPPSSKTSDFLYCLARSAALTLAESWHISKIPDVQQNVIHKWDRLCGARWIIRDLPNYADGHQLCAKLCERIIA